MHVHWWIFCNNSFVLWFFWGDYDVMFLVSVYQSSRVEAEDIICWSWCSSHNYDYILHLTLFAIDSLLPLFFVILMQMKIVIILYLHINTFPFSKCMKLFFSIRHYQAPPELLLYVTSSISITRTHTTITHLLEVLFHHWLGVWETTLPSTHTKFVDTYVVNRNIPIIFVPP